MDVQALKREIAALQSKLDHASSPDPELRALLRDLDRDLQALRDDIDARETGGVGERLRALATRFANRHPRLEPVLEEIATLLSSIGL